MGSCQLRQLKWFNVKNRQIRMTPIYDALKIAVNFLEERQLMRTENFKLTASRVAQEWVFWFVFLPETPGRDVTVFVADDGETRYLAGI
jgi:hypothetical protein